MNVKQLIAELEKISNKYLEVEVLTEDYKYHEVQRVDYLSNKKIALRAKEK